VGPKISATRQVIETYGLASGSSPITKAKGVRTVMPQFFYPFNTEEDYTLLAKGEETTTPQAARHKIFVSQEYMYIKKTHNFPPINLWSVNFKCVKWHKSL
jgi:hypothetical protein